MWEKFINKHAIYGDHLNIDAYPLELYVFIEDVSIYLSSKFADKNIKYMKKLIYALINEIKRKWYGVSMADKKILLLEEFLEFLEKEI